MNLQNIKDAIFFPIRVLFEHDRVRAWGLTSLLDERLNICQKYRQGFALDEGCGDGNEFIRKYSNGVGIDVCIRPGIDVCCDTANLPFRDETFDTVTFIASLNYAKDRVAVLREAVRVLKINGTILIVSPNPIVYWIRKKLIAWWDRYGGEEVFGFWESDIRSLFEVSGLRYHQKIFFVYGLNRLFIGKKIVGQEDKNKKLVVRSNAILRAEQ